MRSATHQDATSCMTERSRLGLAVHKHTTAALVLSRGRGTLPTLLAGHVRAKPSASRFRPARSSTPDMHNDVHVAAVVTAVGRMVTTKSLEATALGYRRILAWARIIGRHRHRAARRGGSTGSC